MEVSYVIVQFCYILGLMAENGRLPKVRGILGAFNNLMSAHRGEILCTVTTAQVFRMLLLMSNIDGNRTEYVLGGKC